MSAFAYKYLIHFNVSIIMFTCVLSHCKRRITNHTEAFERFQNETSQKGRKNELVCF